MDATGDYSGTWNIEVKEGEGEESTSRMVECGTISLTLNQDVTLDPADNLKVTGVLNVDNYSCLTEAGWPEKLVPEPTEINLSGVMGSKDGKLFLASGGLGAGSGAVFIMDGFGEADSESEEEIPDMIYYSGDWGFAVSLVFLGTVGVGGTFELERDE
jgi:hypothetical protein